MTLVRMKRKKKKSVFKGKIAKGFDHVAADFSACSDFFLLLLHVMLRCLPLTYFRW